MDTTTSGAAASTSDHSTVRECSPAKPSTSRPPASSIICGTQWPPTYNGSSHSRAAVRGRDASATARSTASMRAADSATSRAPASGAPTVSARRGHVGEYLADGGRVERDDRRAGGQALGHGLYVLERHGTDGAHGLGDDEVHPEARELRLVELVERLAAAGALTHRAIDLGGRQALFDHAAGQMRQLLRAWRIITLVGYPGHGIAETEREQHLGGRGNE